MCDLLRALQMRFPQSVREPSTSSNVEEMVYLDLPASPCESLDGTQPTARVLVRTLSINVSSLLAGVQDCPLQVREWLRCRLDHLCERFTPADCLLLTQNRPMPRPWANLDSERQQETCRFITPEAIMNEVHLWMESTQRSFQVLYEPFSELGGGHGTLELGCLLRNRFPDQLQASRHVESTTEGMKRCSQVCHVLYGDDAESLLVALASRSLVSNIVLCGPSQPNLPHGCPFNIMDMETLMCQIHSAYGMKPSSFVIAALLCNFGTGSLPRLFHGPEDATAALRRCEDANCALLQDRTSDMTGTPSNGHNVPSRPLQLDGDNLIPQLDWRRLQNFLRQFTASAHELLPPPKVSTLEPLVEASHAASQSLPAIHGQGDTKHARRYIASLEWLFRVYHDGVRSVRVAAPVIAKDRLPFDMNTPSLLHLAGILETDCATAYWQRTVHPQSSGNRAAEMPPGQQTDGDRHVSRRKTQFSHNAQLREWLDSGPALGKRFRVSDAYHLFERWIVDEKRKTAMTEKEFYARFKHLPGMRRLSRRSQGVVYSRVI